MGSHCPHAHVGLRTDTAGSAAKAMAEMSRLRDAATSAQQPVPVWLFRENSCRQGGVQWRRVGPEHSTTLEAAFGENPSNTDVRLSGTYSASFAQMMLFNRSDRGERRPLQRVLLAAAPQWFAIPEDTEPGAADVELRHFAASAAEMLEHCYVTALRSHFGLLAFEEAAWVNLHRMQLTVLRTGARYRLHRQVVAAMPGGPPSDLYRHPLLQSASFITSATDGTAVIQCRPTDHRVGPDSRNTATRLTQLGEPVALQLEDIVPGLRPPQGRCEGVKCVHRRDSTHLRTARHLCPLGRRSDCFLCLGLSAAPDAVRRRAAHGELFDTPGPYEANEVVPGRSDQSELALAVHAWQDRMRREGDAIARIHHRAANGTDLKSPPARSLSPAAGAGGRDMADSLLRSPMTDGLALSGMRSPGAFDVSRRREGNTTSLTFVDPDSVEFSELAAALESSARFTRATERHIQRVVAPERLREYLRWRNETQAEWMRVDGLLSDAADQAEDVLFLPVPRSDVALQDAETAPDGSVAFRSLDAACAQAFASHAASLDDTGAARRRAAHVAAVLTYRGPTKADGATTAVMSVKCPDPADARMCLVYTAQEAGAGAYRLFDTSQFVPLYLITVITVEA
jgi:hypothetical protein